METTTGGQVGSRIECSAGARGVVGVELLAVGMVVAGLCVTAWLLILFYDHSRKVEGSKGEKRVEVAVSAQEVVEPEPGVGEVDEGAPFDRTPGLLREIGEATRKARSKSEEVGLRVELLARAKEAAESQLVQVEATREDLRRHAELLLGEANRLEAEVEVLGGEVDVLERRKEELERLIQKRRAEAGYALLPYKGANGTWRRPIAVECTGGGATFPPAGPTYGLSELSALQGPGTPFISAVIRLATYVQSAGAPDGAEVIPYVVFVVRPDGIRPFYEARSRVDALGIAYGYELVEHETPVEFPALDDPTIWGDLRAIGEKAVAARGGGRRGLDGPGAVGEIVEGLPRGVPLPGEIGSPRSLDELLRGEPGLREALSGRGGGVGTRLGPPPGLSHGEASTLPGSSPREGALGGGAEASGRARSTAPVRMGRPGPEEGVAEGLVGSTAEENGGRGVGSGEEDGRPVRPVHRSRGLGVPGGGWQDRGRVEGGSGGASTALSGARPEEEVLKLVVVCTGKGVILHPGGYRLPAAAVKKDPERLVELVRGVVENRKKAVPGRVIWPRVEFLIEKSGEPLYWPARQRIESEWPGWPIHWKVAEPSPFKLFGQDRW